MITEDFSFSQFHEIISNDEIWKVSTRGDVYPSAIVTKQVLTDRTLTVFLDLEYSKPVGILVCKQHIPKNFTCHVGYLKPHRGRRAIDAAKEVAAKMFEYGAQCLVAPCAEDRPAARMFAALVGFRFEIYHPQAIRRPDGRLVGLYFYTMRPSYG